MGGSVSYPSMFARLLANSEESETQFYEGTPCWNWKSNKQVRGYGRLTKRIPGRPKPVKVMAHREMAEIVIERPLTDDETIDHGCVNTGCIHYLHFRLASNADNVADMRARYSGKPRKPLVPLIDLKLYAVDPFIRALPCRRDQEQPCPF